MSSKRIKFVLTALQLATVPFGGSLLELNSHRSDWQMSRLGVLVAFDPGAEPNPNKFRFRIPRLGEIPDLIPRYRPSETPFPIMTRATTEASLQLAQLSSVRPR